MKRLLAAILIIVLSVMPVCAESSFYSWGVQAMGADILMADSNKPDGKVTVGLIDTGVDRSSTLFANRVTDKKDYIDSATDDGHGTAVAGIILEMTKGFGVKINVYKAVDENGEIDADTLKSAALQAYSDGCDIINLSLSQFDITGNATDWPSIFNELVQNGVTVCIAAGDDDGLTASDDIAKASGSGILVVSAVNSDKKQYSNCNEGDNIAFCAPGAGIKVYWPDGLSTTKSGSDFACAHISAATALVMLYKGTKSPSKVETALRGICDGLGESAKYGHGMPVLSRLIKTEPSPSASASIGPSPSGIATPEPTPTNSGEIILKGKCGENCAYELSNDGILTVSGEGGMYDYDENGAPWLQHFESVKEIVIKENIDYVGAYAFYSCMYAQSAEIASSVKKIGEYAFANCKNIESIELPDGLEKIADKAFYGCGSLSEIKIPASVTVIGEDVFEGCDKVVLIAEPGSYGEQYAKDNDLMPKPTDTPLDPSPTPTASAAPTNSVVPTASPSVKPTNTPSPVDNKPTNRPTSVPNPTPTHALIIKISDENIDIGVNCTHTLRILNGEGTTRWSTSDNSIARVTYQGIVTGMAEGTCVIYAINSGVKLECRVNVHMPQFAEKSIKAGLASSSKLELLYASGTVKYKSSDKKIVKVSQKGVITAVKKGKAKITAIVNGYKVKCNITVKDNKKTYKTANEKTVKLHFALKKLELKDKKLTVTVKVYNNSGAKIKKIKSVRVSVYDKKDGVLKASATFKNVKVDIKDGASKKLTLSFKASKLKDKKWDIVRDAADPVIVIEKIVY